MARYYELEVYRASYLLLVESYKSLGNLNREYKYTVGAKIKEQVFEILLEIYRASRAGDKALHVNRALDYVEYVRLSIRLLRDLGVLNDAKYTHLVTHVEAAGEQFEKWHVYLEKK